MPKLTNTMHFMWNLILRGLIHSYKRRKWIFLCILTICYYSTCFEKRLNAEGVIFVPFLTTQTLFSRLTRILVSDPLLLPPSKKDLYFPDRRKTIPKIPSVKLLASSCTRKSYQDKGIPDQVTDPLIHPWRWGTQQNYNNIIKEIGQCGKVFAVKGKLVVCSQL